MRIFSLLLLFLVATSLNAQSRKAPEKWIGLHNLFITDSNTLTGPTYISGDSSVFAYDEILDYQLSLGLSFRKLNKANLSYHQFDFLELNWIRNEDFTEVHRLINLDTLISPSGSAFEEFSALTAYQRGKLFPIISQLYADVGIRGFAWYRKTQTTPRGVQGFPFRTKSIGLGLNLELGLSYRIFERLSIGYHFTPITAKLFWNEDYTENPILPEMQRRERSTKLEADFFESIIDVRNFHINYTF